MINDVIHEGKNFLTCQRHHKTKIIEHPAMALPVKSIFEKSWN